ncbi:MAG TPA: HemK2/MTQ2 family protein methyltransferase [Actinophytocola sp.]|uniref:HemK2/MTQ2 family protein methyltransferase n=1 Tax=Actinophytocola sp. TaxID=1872138 RepID=UPI002DBAE0D3|nr:HemK2/MTQ2 family protein methyltransferase [Actinophytocola sp.]HEU5475903.1 HemK2/MTQ2 family protein methyltransferase [Actinophytocola sp.]
MLLRPPGVYRPQADTWLLAKAIEQAALPSEARVLDIGAGTGALSVAAARAGAAEVTAVDVSRRAVLATWFNTAVRGLPVRVRRGDALDVAAGRRFDVILANPPYVPCERPDVPDAGPRRAWDAGLDGRAMVNRVTALAPLLLAPRGLILIVHSQLCGVDRTLHQLRGGGLKASVVARAIEPFGPVMRGRVDFLERAGLIEPGQRHEQLVVIRGDRTEPPA